MTAVRVVDVTDLESFGLVPPCADRRFDHRTCDYWEDADRGSKAHRAAWLQANGAGSGPPEPPPTAARPTGNPFLDDAADAAALNPFAPARDRPTFNPFAPDPGTAVDNPFAPAPRARPSVGPGVPRKLELLGRGLAVFGSYAKVLLADEEAVAYAQFGPLSAYPRAMRLRELYPQLPDAPLPAVITCIASTGAARHRGYALRLVEAVCADLAARGFAAVEAYPERGAEPDATSAATPEFWVAAAFDVVVDDERFPVVRRELG